MDSINHKYVTKGAIEGLVMKIGLPTPDEFSQDWEYVVSDSSRISEFLSAYKTVELNAEEKFALMIIIISSYDDAITIKRVEGNWRNTIRKFLLEDISIHHNTVFYWAMLEEEDLENCFYVTPLMREIITDAQLEEQD